MSRRIAELLRLRVTSDLEWAEVEDFLAHYALIVLTGWVSDGSLVSRVRHISRRTLKLTREQVANHENMTELLGMTIAVSLPRFRRKALTGTGWSPDCKFSVCNYFVGRCLLSFPSEHRRWVREQEGPLGSPRRVPLKKAEKLAATDVLSYPADLAADRDLVRIVFRQADDRTRKILMGILHGYPPSVIATETGNSVREVKLLLERHRENFLRLDFVANRDLG